MSPYWLPPKSPAPAPPHLCCPPPRAAEGEHWTCPKDGCGARWVHRRTHSWEYPEWQRAVEKVGRL